MPPLIPNATFFLLEELSKESLLRDDDLHEIKDQCNIGETSVQWSLPKGLVQFAAVPVQANLRCSLEARGPESMFDTRLIRSAVLGLLIILGAGLTASAQSLRDDQQFGPVVRAYMGYLRNEQEVVDDRVSRHEVSASYYRRNSNRIRALRQMAVQIARNTQNDYLPELEAVAGDELRLLFERPPRFQTLRVGEVVETNFRYLGMVRSGDSFYLFARLDPYEQAELMQKAAPMGDHVAGSALANPVSGARVTTRARRVSTP
jgi:hypothetical protein